MSNAIRRVANYLGLMDEPEFDTAQPQAPAKSSDVRIKSRELRPVPTAPTVRRGEVVETAPQLDLPTLDRIITLHPRYYNEARTIGEHYREGNPVIINLDDMDESERKRLVDFASGLAFGLRGRIEKITSVVFLISPANVIVRTEDKAAYAQASFYNQS